MPDNCREHAGGKEPPCVLCVVCQANKNAAGDYEWPGHVFIRPLHLIGNMDEQYALLGDPIATIVPGKAMHTPHLWRACVSCDNVYVDVVSGMRIDKKLVRPVNFSASFPCVNQIATKDVWHKKNAERERLQNVQFAELDIEVGDQVYRRLGDIQTDFEEMKDIALVPAPQEVWFMEVYVWVYLSL